MALRITGMFAALGCLLVAWLYLSNPHVDFDGPGTEEQVSLACLSLSRMNVDDFDYVVPDRELTTDQSTYVDDYVQPDDGEAPDTETQSARKETLTARVLASASRLGRIVRRRSASSGRPPVCSSCSSSSGCVTRADAVARLPTLGGERLKPPVGR